MMSALWRAGPACLCTQARSRARRTAGHGDRRRACGPAPSSLAGPSSTGPTCRRHSPSPPVSRAAQERGLLDALYMSLVTVATLGSGTSRRPRDGSAGIAAGSPCRFRPADGHGLLGVRDLPGARPAGGSWPSDWRCCATRTGNAAQIDWTVLGGTRCWRVCPPKSCGSASTSPSTPRRTTSMTVKTTRPSPPASATPLELAQRGEAAGRPEVRLAGAMLAGALKDLADGPRRAVPPYGRNADRSVRRVRSRPRPQPFLTSY